MIFDQLIIEQLHRPHSELLFRMEAGDSIRWMIDHGMVLRDGMTALDIATGNGTFGAYLSERGCRVTLVDHNRDLIPDARPLEFLELDLNGIDFPSLGRFDLVICSNFLEHLHARERFLASIPSILNPGGYCYLAWTPWLSPYGGHEYSPWHYFGIRFANWVYRGRRWFRLANLSDPPQAGNTLYPSYVGRTLARLRQLSGVRIIAVAPRYYTEFSWLMRVPIAREFLSWNVAVLIQREINPEMK